MSATELADVVVVGSGYGGSIPAYHLAAGGAKVVVLERGGWYTAEDFTQDMRVGSYSRYVDLVVGDGVAVFAGNCVGGGSVVNFAAMPRVPSFVFDRMGSVGRRQWPREINRHSLDPWYDLVEHTLPVTLQTWKDVPYAGGVFAAACNHAGRTAQPMPQAIDLSKCTNCGWQYNGCRFDAKRSMLLNYLPAAQAHGAQIRPLHEVQSLSPAQTNGYRYRVNYLTMNADNTPAGSGCIEAKLVVLAAGTVATPVILQRSAQALGGMPAAVGRHFSTNGDYMNVAVIDEDKVRDVLGLERPDGKAYEGLAIGKNVGTMSYDGLDKHKPEFTRFSLHQLFFPPIAAVLAQVPDAASDPTWFGVAKKELRRKYMSWLMVLGMGEDDNEGVFGPPPETGAFHRVMPGVAQNSLQYHPTENTRRYYASVSAELQAIFGTGGIGEVRAETFNLVGVPCTHPLSSVRIGDDPATSALDHRHELRGHPGIFVTDGSAVPTSLTVNPSLTISALAERASVGIIRRARHCGVEVRYGAPSPSGETSGRDAVMRLPMVQRAGVG